MAPVWGFAGFRGPLHGHYDPESVGECRTKMAGKSKRHYGDSHSDRHFCMLKHCEEIGSERNKSRQLKQLEKRNTLLRNEILKNFMDLVYRGTLGKSKYGRTSIGRYVFSTYINTYYHT